MHAQIERALASVAVLSALLACKAQDTGSATSETESQAKAAAPAKPEKPPEPAVKIDAKKLGKEFGANEARANLRYKDKVLEVSGTVESITSDLMDDPVVNLKGKDFMTNVMLSDVEKRVAVSLNKGDKVTFRCTCDGEIMGSPTLSDCTKVP